MYKAELKGGMYESGLYTGLFPSDSGLADFIIDGRAQNDANALAVISACSLGAGAQQNAAFFLVGALKAYSLWGKMVGLYGLAGGTAAAHSVNWKSPGTYDIQNVANATWTGMTHNSNGITGNGSTQYGDTGIVPSTVLSLTNCHLSGYLRTNTTENKAGMGSVVVNNRFYFHPYYADALSYVGLAAATEKTSPGGPGFTLASKTAANSFKVFFRSRLVGTSTVTDTALPNINAYICGVNNNGVLSASNRNFAFFSIGSGLTDTEACNLSWIVQAYQTLLGRQV